MIPIDHTFLTRISPRFRGKQAAAQFQIISKIAPVFQDTTRRYDIHTRLRIAHFLAQILHESAGLRTTEEFASGAAYEGRLSLGNTESGDGRRFKGRGLLQLTGRANYRRLGDKLKIDLLSDPQRAAEPELSLIIACEYWKQHNINDSADRDDVRAVTKAVNGGLNGLADRQRHLARIKRELGRANIQPLRQMPYLRRGATGEAVAKLQSKLVSAGHKIAIDGDFGPQTDRALRTFQEKTGLMVDGIFGPATCFKLSVSASNH
ncbi:MAG: peptidoglycan-binding protein [Hyphomicrobiales bacterium]